jgi:hypothetical protein
MSLFSRVFASFAVVFPNILHQPASFAFSQQLSLNIFPLLIANCSLAASPPFAFFGFVRGSLLNC